MQAEPAANSANDAARVEDATIISRSPSVLTAEVDGEVVMMSIERGRYFGLDDIGSDIWKRLDPPCSFGELIDRLASDYEADPAPIAADVRALLGRLAEQALVGLARPARSPACPRSRPPTTPPRRHRPSSHR